MRALWALMVMGACAEAPAPVRGPIVTEIGHELRVCVSGGQLEPGAIVHFQRQLCGQDRKLRPMDCRQQGTGSGRVVRILDARCAVVELDPSVDARSGDEVVVVR